jgi:hypothetical protein
MEILADLLLLRGVLGPCSDCGDEQILVPAGRSGDYCCTVCDAAVVVGLPDLAPPPSKRHVRGAA